MNLSNVRLSTDRLILRTLDRPFAGRVVHYYHGNRRHLSPWEPHRDKSFYTVQLQRDYLKRERQEMRRGELLKLWIFKNGDTSFSRIIGVISFSNIIEGCFLSCFLGYSMDAAESGKGYMTEALGSAIRYVFDTVRLHRIEANVQPENAPSLRVVQKLGFREEGLARKYLKIDGQWCDHLHMVLLNPAVE